MLAAKRGYRGSGAGSHGGMAVSRALRRRATRLLTQQFWCFGCDIRRPEGNLLLADGFVKHRPPDGAAITSSRYTRCLDPTHSIVLWGFGLAWIDNTDVLFLSRHTIVPVFGCLECAIGDAWVPEDFGSLRRPDSSRDVARSRDLLLEALRWIRAYEHRVSDLLGVAYRASSLAAWKRPACAAEQVADEWMDVIDRLQSDWLPIRR